MERGAAFRRPRRAHGACSHTAGRAVPPQIALAASNPKPPPPVFAAAGVAGRPLRGVRRRRRNASPVTPSRQTKRINASPRALRFRLGRIARRRRRHGHVLEEDGRLRLEVAGKRRGSEDRQRDDEDHNEQSAGG